MSNSTQLLAALALACGAFSANAVESVVLSGNALAEGETINLVERDNNTFDVFTRLNGGESFVIEVDGTPYGITDGKLAQGNVTVEKNGVYRIKTNFNNGEASVEQVTGVGLFYCWRNGIAIDLKYTGNGVFKGYGDLTLEMPAWGPETRYRLQMEIGGHIQSWGPTNDGLDWAPNGAADYFDMKETNPGNQWDNKWKFDDSKRDGSVLKGLEVIADFNAKPYTHAINYGVEAPAEPIVTPDALTISGAALAEADSYTMNKVGGAFEIFTTLNGGKTFTVSDGTNSYISDKGEIAQGGEIEVPADGIYCININFDKGTFDFDEVTKVGVFYCWDNKIVDEGAKYKGNGTWEQTIKWDKNDDRYKFKMELGGRNQFWGPTNTGLDWAPNGAADYFDVIRSTPASQWDNKWKVAGDLKGKEIKFTLKLNGDKYTHTQEDAALTGIENIAVGDDATPEYFNLQGIRVANPANGIYIRRCGNKVEKVLVK